MIYSIDYKQKEDSKGYYISGPTTKKGRAKVIKENSLLLQKKIWKASPSLSTNRFNVLASMIQETQDSTIPSSFIQNQSLILSSNNLPSDADAEGYQEVRIQRPL